MSVAYAVASSSVEKSSGSVSVRDTAICRVFRGTVPLSSESNLSLTSWYTFCPLASSWDW